MPNDPAPSEPSPKPRELAWRTLFQRSRSAVFVINGRRQLRYANPAWEAATGADFAALRGTKFAETRTSASPLWAALAPPREIWRGESARVRRPAPGNEHGPPWWDLTYVPLRGNGDRILGVVGTLEVVGAAPLRGAVKLPAIFETLCHRRTQEFTFELLGGDSPALERLKSQLRWAAEHRAPTWLVGEAGTGKETLARAMHGAGAGRFVGLECSGLQPYLLEGMLFGKGGLAATLSVGTLYLKQPSKLPRDLQTRIAEHCGGAGAPHLICGSPRPVAAQVASGVLIPRFQTHLATVEVRLPPLRERLDELPQFLARIDSAPVGEEVLRILRAYPWPGNFHELGGVWHGAVGRASGGAVLPEHLPRFVRESFLIESSAEAARIAPGLDAVLEAVERRMIQRALAQSKGQQTEAAAKLGIFRTRLARRLEALKIVRSPETPS